MRKIKKASWDQVLQVMQATDLLRIARDKLKTADCPKTLERVRAALSSAKGAQRHVSHRARRTESSHV